MVIRNISIEENYAKIGAVLGPNFSELTLIVSDWPRFIDRLREVEAGRQVSFEDKRDEDRRFEITIINADKGIKNLGG